MGSSSAQDESTSAWIVCLLIPVFKLIRCWKIRLGTNFVQLSRIFFVQQDYDGAWKLEFPLSGARFLFLYLPAVDRPPSFNKQGRLNRPLLTSLRNTFFFIAPFRTPASPDYKQKTRWRGPAHVEKPLKSRPFNQTNSITHDIKKSYLPQEWINSLLKHPIIPDYIQFVVCFKLEVLLEFLWSGKMCSMSFKMLNRIKENYEK